MKPIFIFFLSVLFFGENVLAATVSCKVQSVNGSTIILQDCDEKRVMDFQKGDRVKVKLDKKIK